MNARLLVVVPPDLDPLGAIFTSEPRRALLAARAFAAVERARKRGAGVLVDAGESGLSATSTARRAAGRGVENALILGGPFDVAAVDALASAFRTAGVAFRAVIDDRPGAAASALESEIRILMREADGRSPPPPGFDDPAPRPPIRVDLESALFAPILDEPPRDEVSRAVAHAARAGADRVRLAPDPAPRANASVDVSAPPWARSRALDRPEVRERLGAVVRAATPGVVGVFERALRFVDCGIDPFGAAYADDATYEVRLPSVAAPNFVEQLTSLDPSARRFADAIGSTFVGAPDGVAAPRFVAIDLDGACAFSRRIVPPDPTLVGAPKPDRLLLAVFDADGDRVVGLDEVLRAAEAAPSFWRAAAPIPTILERRAGGVSVPTTAAPSAAAVAWEALFRRTRPEWAIAARVFGAEKRRAEGRLPL